MLKPAVVLRRDADASHARVLRTGSSALAGRAVGPLDVRAGHTSNRTGPEPSTGPAGQGRAPRRGLTERRASGPWDGADTTVCSKWPTVCHCACHPPCRFPCVVLPMTCTLHSVLGPRPRAPSPCSFNQEREGSHGLFLSLLLSSLSWRFL